MMILRFGVANGHLDIKYGISVKILTYRANVEPALVTDVHNCHFRVLWTPRVFYESFSNYRVQKVKGKPLVTVEE